MFVHLLDDAEKVWGQRDVAPGGGFAPNGSVRTGQEIEDRSALTIDPAAPPGNYRLEIGMYLPQTGARLPARDATGAELGNRVLLPDLIRVAP